MSESDDRSRCYVEHQRKNDYHVVYPELCEVCKKRPASLSTFMSYHIAEPVYTCKTCNYHVKCMVNNGFSPRMTLRFLKGLGGNETCRGVSKGTFTRDSCRDLIDALPFSQGT